MSDPSTVSQVDVLAAPPVRAQDWDAFAVPDGYRAEVIQGELVVTPGPPLSHGRAQSRLTVLLAAAAPAGYEPVVEPEWRLEVGGLVGMAPRPDIVVISRHTTGPAVTEPPLLAVEILSPSDQDRLADGRTRREGKLADYAANGLRDYLEIDLTVSPPTAVRYELQEGVLVGVERAVGREVLAASRPFAYSLAPADLV